MAKLDTALDTSHEHLVFAEMRKGPHKLLAHKKAVSNVENG
jgi:hypothetical protein